MTELNGGSAQQYKSEKIGNRSENSYLGKIVDIFIDRPLGSTHPKHDDIIYPINYGFIPGVIGGDGEELDVYLLGVDTPVNEYSGRIIGIVHRENDVEDKLVMAPDGVIFTQNEIAEEVHFQEQYFKTEVEALYQKSCGAVVFKREAYGIKLLCLSQRRSQTNSVPKGHMEAFETEEQTAKREIREEIGLSAEFIPGFKETIHYDIQGGKHKTVLLFLAECTGQLKIDDDEIDHYSWLSMQEAKTALPEWYLPVVEKLSAKFEVK